MNTKTYISLSASLMVASIIFSGCTETSTQQESISNIKPHYIGRRLEGDDLPVNYEDFAANIEMEAAINDEIFSLKIASNEYVLTYDMAHMQVYIDIDNDENTGLSIGDGAYAIVGADYMVEDNQLFKSTSNDEWEWEYIDDVENDEQGLGISPSALYSKNLTIGTELFEGIEIDNDMKIRISVEPIDEEWEDTNNYVPVQTLTLTTTGPMQVERVGNIEGLTIPMPESYRWKHTWKTQFIDILGESAYALSKHGAALGGGSHYRPYAVVVTSIDFSDEGNPTVLDQLEVGAIDVPVDMYVDPPMQYIYVITRGPAMHTLPNPATYLTVVDRSDATNLRKISKIKIYDNPISNDINITKEDNILHIQNSVQETVEIDISDPSHPVKL